MINAQQSIQKQYGSNDLMSRVAASLRALGHDPTHPTVETLNLIDQLHTGGLGSTKAQAELVGIARDMRVLDAGCGLGGASRYLAHTYGCRVDAIDVTPQCVEAAAHLNELCGLGNEITVRLGSVTALPYADKSFDVVWSQSVAMNVEDKPHMFAEAHRVLKQGGRFALSCAARGTGEPYYPLPWAADPSASFLCTPAEIEQWLCDAGFSHISVQVESSGGSKARPSTVMGDDMAERQANSARSVHEGRLIRMIYFAVR
jgi:sarcosine/dimethylglycine N-methyltransferase